MIIQLLFKEDCNSQQQALDADSGEIQQISFTPNLNGAVITTMLFINEEARETVLDFSQGTIRVM